MPQTEDFILFFTIWIKREQINRFCEWNERPLIYDWPGNKNNRYLNMIPKSIAKRKIPGVELSPKQE